MEGDNGVGDACVWHRGRNARWNAAALVGFDDKGEVAARFPVGDADVPAIRTKAGVEACEDQAVTTTEVDADVAEDRRWGLARAQRKDIAAFHRHRRAVGFGEAVGVQAPCVLDA